MAGGRGTRFWPASRERMPKQFLAVGGKDSLLRATGLRLSPLSDSPWVVTNAAHVDLAAEQLPEVPRDRVVGEPVGRNTAPCVALTAALVAREDPEGILLVAPADHWIGDPDEFLRAVHKAADVADERKGLVTFGVVPTSPDTGYGYIEAGPEVEPGVHEVARFTEKPDRETAERFLAGGQHFWNSGIFAWRADVFLEELDAHHPDLVKGCREIAAAGDRGGAMAEIYPALTSISVDYAVLERSSRVFMVVATFPWSDVGSWDAVAGLSTPDHAGNVLPGDALAVDSSGCYVRSEKFTAIVGLENVLVVDTPDALLVCPADRAQDVKKVVESLEEGGRKDLL